MDADILENTQLNKISPWPRSRDLLPTTTRTRAFGKTSLDFQQLTESEEAYQQQLFQIDKTTGRKAPFFLIVIFIIILSIKHKAIVEEFTARPGHLGQLGNSTVDLCEPTMSI